MRVWLQSTKKYKNGQNWQISELTLCVQLLTGTADGRTELLMMGANFSFLPRFSDTHLTTAEIWMLCTRKRLQRTEKQKIKIFLNSFQNYNRGRLTCSIVFGIVVILSHAELSTTALFSSTKSDWVTPRASYIVFNHSALECSEYKRILEYFRRELPKGIGNAFFSIPKGNAAHSSLQIYAVQKIMQQNLQNTR